MFKIDIPSGARDIINKLQSAGHEAYVVGGCVRDSILGLTPSDWDICTSASPEEVTDIVGSYEIIPTGLKHGTVTALADGGISSELVGYEITTFRKDGEYKDNRHPESVEFVKSLKEDLARRDFTINAMAYSDATGIVDYFGGVDDIGRKVISCVGNPDDRFAEDALRMMRAMRFSSTYGFSIAPETSAAIHRNKAMLDNIAAERIQTELIKTLFGNGVLDVLTEYSDVIAQIIPEIKPCIGFDQNNRWHQYTVYDHIAHAVSNYRGNDASVKLALLLHDIGKPECYTEDERGGHFYGHPKASSRLAKVIVERLRLDSKTQREVIELVRLHDSNIEPTPKTVRRWLRDIGEHRLSQLLDVILADRLAHADGTQEVKIEKCNELRRILCGIIESEQCFSLKKLAVDGDDIKSLGVPEGKLVGHILNSLLNAVVDSEVQNEREALMHEARKLILIESVI